MASIESARSAKKPSRPGSAFQASSEPKKRGFSMYGPPSSGQKVSQLPHSLQKSWKFAI